MDLEFQQELENKRHDELLSVLTAIFKKLQSQNGNDKAMAMLSEELKIIGDNIEKSLGPNTSAVKDIKKLSTAWAKVIDKINPKAEPIKNWTFEVNRNKDGFIKSIEAIARK